MIFLKIKHLGKNAVKKAVIIVCSGLVFFFGSYMYLEHNLNKGFEKTDIKDYTVPYSQRPENAGIAFLLPDGSALLAYLDFEKSCINVINIEMFDSENSVYYGYTADFTVQTDYEFIGGIIDRVGGINIENGNETLRYTGIQAVDLISENTNSNIKNQIIGQIFEQISKNGFSKEDFLYIIENGTGSLTLTDCIYWFDSIDDVCKNIIFVN